MSASAPPPVAGPPQPPRPPEPHADPLLVLLASAALPGAGHLLLRRPGAAALALLTTTGLVALLAAYAARWWEVLLVLWWAAIALHGWVVSGGRRRLPAREAVVRGRRHLAAFTACVVVAAGVVSLRVQAQDVADTVATARAEGRCEEVRSAQQGLSGAVRLGDAPRSAQGDRVVEACERLEAAEEVVRRGLAPEAVALDEGFDMVNALRSAHEPLVAPAMRRLAREIDSPENACDRADLTDLLRGRSEYQELSRDVPPELVDAAEESAPAALLECGEGHFADESWSLARDRYQRMIEDFPEEAATEEAREHDAEAQLHMELERVTELLSGGYHDYCDEPAPYSGADPAGEGENRLLLSGDTEFTARIPGDWRADAPEEATMVVCAAEAERGTLVETCPYEYGIEARVWDVDFYTAQVPVTVYELRTGEAIVEETVSLNGASCPDEFEYETYAPSTSPPPPQFVAPSSSQAREAFGGLVGR